MHETIYQFIHAHYTEILAVFPMVLLLNGLWIAVGIDQYIQKQIKRIMLIICALVFSLIAQNFLDNWLTYGTPMITLRKVIDIYGYSIRPVILLLFLYIVSPPQAQQAVVGGDRRQRRDSSDGAVYGYLLYDRRK